MMKLSLFLLAILCLPLSSSAEEAVYPRHPSLSPDGSSLAFDWRGDVWTVPVTGGRALRITAHDAHDGYPHWSPDGTRIAFQSRRHGNWDLFVMDLAGLVPRRLTFHSGDDYLSGWSPDGSTLYFSSTRRGRRPQLFAIGAGGGAPTRVIGDDAFGAEISPNGKWIAYQRGFTNWWRKHYVGWASRDVWIRAIEGGESFHVVSWHGDDDAPHWSADGNALIFQSERNDGTPNLWRQELLFDDDEVAPFGKAVQLTHLAEDGIQYLSVSRDGHHAAFEWKGALYAVPTGGGEPQRINIDVPGDLKANALTRERLSRGATEFAFAPDEEQVAFVVQGEIYCATLDDEGELDDPIRITETDAREKDLAWLDEHTLLFVSDRFAGDDIFSVASTDEDEPLLGKSRKREVTRLTDHAETERDPQPAPDGESILYKRDIGHLWTMAPDGTAQTARVTEGKVLHSDWSPDSRYVAYSRTALGSAEDIYVYDLETGDVVNVSTHPHDDFHPLWTADGKRLAWASRDDGSGDYQIKYLWLTREEADKSEREREREEKEKDEPKDEAEEDEEAEEPELEVKIDWEGIPDRVVTVTTLRGYYWDYDQSPDGKHYAIEAQTLDGTDLWAIDWDGDNLRRLTRGGTNPGEILWAEDNSTIRYISGGQMREVKNKENASPSTLGFSVPFTADARARRLQKLREAWRKLDDGFYDENFHGVDWPAMREKYEPLAEAAVMTEDFNDVIKEMIGELNASHLNIWGGPRPGEGSDRSAHLGFEPDDAFEGPGLLVDWVLPRGPLDREGKRLAAGDVILAIDGETVEAGMNFWPLLAHKSGEEVDLLVLAGGEEREITVEPISHWRERWLRYQHWMDENRRMVEEQSGGRLAYLHMSAMGSGNWEQFIVDIFSKTEGAEGLVLDVRYNNGGRIHDQVLTFLSRRTYNYSIGRGDVKPTYESQRRWDGPIVVLINERSYSDGEIFPAGFKALGLGRVVGMPTFGAVIGTSNVPLIDGSTFRIPGTGWYNLDGTNLENGPVHPDLYVPDVPEENLAGRDSQLEAGVTECLKMLESAEH